MNQMNFHKLLAMHTMLAGCIWLLQHLREKATPGNLTQTSEKATRSTFHTPRWFGKMLQIAAFYGIEKIIKE